jgi:uncharacterized membrane protein YccC
MGTIGYRAEFSRHHRGYAPVMPISAQPPGRRGDVDQPYSALNLRLVLALFGCVVCTVLAVLLWRAGWTVPGWILAAWAVVALVDAVVVQLRRRARRRAEGGRDHSLFE